MSGRWGIVAVVVAGFFAAPPTAQTQGLQATYSDQGVSTLSYNGVTLIDAARHSQDFFDIGEYRRIRPDGSVINEWGGLGFTRSMDIANRELIWRYAWGFVKCRYIQTSDRLSMQLTITNNDPSITVAGMSIFPLAMRFPSFPNGYDAYTPKVIFNTVMPGVVAANYGSGQVVMTVEDIDQVMYAGWFPTGETASTRRYPLWFGTTPYSGQAQFWPKLERRVPPGQSNTYTVSLRFAPGSASSFDVASDTYQAFRTRWPQQLDWTDRRPIGALHLSTSATGWPTNPRGWLVDQNLNVFTTQGLANFHQRILDYATNAVNVLRDMGAQGMVVWDIEGQEYPHATSYIGDPRLVPTLAPEIDGVADAFFRKFRDAGLKVGVGLRPEQFIRDGSGVRQAETADPAQQLIDKISYAKQRWGCTMFYVDSNGGPSSPTDPVVFKRVLEAHPDVLIMPEHENTKYWAYTAPYGEFDLGTTGTPAEPAYLYPPAFSVTYVSEANLTDNRDRLIEGVRRGDVLMFRGWVNEGWNTAVKDIYRLAGRPLGVDSAPPQVAVTSPGAGTTVGGTITVTANAADDRGVAGVQFKVDGVNFGGEDTQAPYAVSLNTSGLSNGGHTVSATARDAAGNVATSTVSFTVSNVTDVAPPTVNITAPASGATVSGTVTVTANASDDRGVAGVQFKVDGVNIGAEDTQAPYAVSWAASSAGPGAHTLTAVARDIAGKTTTSAGIGVTVPDTTAGYWRMEEGGGTSLADSSGNGFNGVLIGGPQWTSGVTGGGLRFDGVDDSVQIADRPGLRLNDLTLSLWVRGETWSGMRTLLSKPGGAANDNSYVLYTVDGVPHFHSTNFSAMIRGSAALPLNAWAQLTLVKSGGSVSLYINGQQVASGSGAPVAPAYDGRPLLLGGEDDLGTGRAAQYMFRGSMDEVKLWPRALNATEVTQFALPPAAGDSQAPAITLTAPVGGATISGAFLMTATATDNVGVAGVQFYVDGAAYGTEQRSDPWRTSLDTTPLADGPHTIYAIARDAAGNRRQTPTVNVTVRNSAPAPVFVRGLNLNGAAVTIDGNLWLSSTQASAAGVQIQNSIGWRGGLGAAAEPAFPGTAVQSVLETVVYTPGGAAGTGLRVTQPVSSGTYLVYLWIGENYRSNSRALELKLEGQTAATSLGDLVRGSWRKYGPYTINVTDGVLNIDVLRGSVKVGDPHLAGVAVYRQP